ncbi:MAG TPA: hypothetical protein VG737_08685 [Cyclobacteriaceae bacterium]|nr:hypothetical protein [Cyclobacteriaceae bacterium]
MRGTSVALVVLQTWFSIALIAFSISVRAQGKQDDEKVADGNWDLINAEKKIIHAPHINLGAEAVPLKSTINSGYVELKPAVTPRGDRLYFSRSVHPLNYGGVNDDEDIWYADFDSAAGDWLDPVRMPGFLNNRGPNFITNVSVTGDSIGLGNTYSLNGKMRDGVSYSVNVKGKWSFPKPIPIQNYYNTSAHGNFFISLRYGVLISAIERFDSYGGRDLYISFWNGEYCSEPINMGSIINTEQEEASAHLAQDGKTLYFASKGHVGYGGYDIWVTRRLDDTWRNWSQPQNLGPAVNGSLDEEFFILTHCGQFAVFSKQVSVHNVDLYKIPTAQLFTPDGLARIGTQVTTTTNNNFR